MAAVVCLSEGKMETGEFLRHVEGLGEPRNPFVLHPIGYCAEKGRRVVVYPYMPNKSLKDHLHGTETLTPEQKTISSFFFFFIYFFCYFCFFLIYNSCHHRLRM